MYRESEKEEAKKIHNDTIEKHEGKFTFASQKVKSWKSKGQKFQETSFSIAKVKLSTSDEK